MKGKIIIGVILMVTVSSVPMFSGCIEKPEITTTQIPTVTPSPVSSLMPTVTPTLISETVKAKEFPIFKVWTDPAEGAFSIIIPKDWNANGGTERIMTDPNFIFEAYSGDAKIFFYIPTPIRYWEPTTYDASRGYPEGTKVQEYGLDLFILRYHSGREYISNIILPQLQQGYPDAKITSIQDLPDVAKAYGEPLATQTEAASATISFTANGIPMKAGYTVIVDREIYGQNIWGETMGLWIAKVIGAIAPEAEFDSVTELYAMILPTSKINPTWQQYELEGRQQRSAMIRSTSQRIIEMDYQMFQEESESRMRLARGWMNAFGGTETVKDKYGTEYTVPSGPGMNYWWNKAGDIRPTELDQQPDIGYERMEKLK